MAVVRNVTPDALALFRADAPLIRPGDEVTVSDENFVGRAWPKSVWALVKKPGKGFKDASPVDAYLFLPAAADEDATPEATASSDTEEN